MVDTPAFFKKAIDRMTAHRDILFITMPHVVAFNEALEHRMQYDRRQFEGMTGLELLGFLVHTGEMSVLTLGSVFRQGDLKGIEPEDFFRVSEDYVFLARLCARYPDRTLEVGGTGHYWRLMQQQSLSAREAYSLEKILMHLVSMFVAAYYLFKMGRLRTPLFQEILRRRGEVLKGSYGRGDLSARWLAALLNDSDAAAVGAEQERARAFLMEARAALPSEFRSLVGWGVSTPAPV
jgi:hypothetical protein